MKKKILSGILISSALTLPIFAVAVSCDTEQKAKDEKLKKELNDVGKKVTFDYPNKQDLFPDKAVREKVTIKEYDQNKYKIEVKKIVPDAGKNTVTVTFVVKAKNSNATSLEITKKIEGFKATIDKDKDKDKDNAEKFDNVAKALKLDYPNKQNLLAKSVDVNKVDASNYDKTKFSIDIKKSVVVTNDDTKVEVTFTLRDLKTQEVSSEITKLIEGFKSASVEIKELDEVAKKVTLEYPEKVNVVPADAKSDKVQTSGYDTTKYEVMVTSVTPDNAKKSVTVSYIVTSKLTKLTSAEVKKIIEGFKTPEVGTESINDIAEKVEFDYPNIANVLTKDIEDSKFTTSNLDKEVYEIVLKVEKIQNTNSVRIIYHIKNKKTNATSKSITKILGGFKSPMVAADDLDAIANGVTLEFPDKANVIAKDAELNKVTSSGFDVSKYEITLEKIENDDAKGLVLVTFKIVDKMTKKASTSVKKQITGFKVEVDLDALANKVTLEYPGKANIPSKVAELGKVQSSGFDAAKYEIELEKIDKDNVKKLVEVTFKIVDKVTKKASSSVKKQITGFREDVDLDAIAKTVRLSYPNPEKVLVKDAVATAITSSGYDTTKFEVEIKKISPDNSTRILLVIFSVKDKTSQLSSTEITKEILGFKNDKVVVEDLDAIAKGVNLDYPGKENVLLKDADKSKVESKGYDKNTYDVLITNFTTNKDKLLVSVTFVVQNKKTQQKSAESTQNILGFKAEVISNDALNALANKVILDYPKKAEVFVKDATSGVVETSGIDKAKYLVTIKSFVKDEVKKSVKVTFFVQDITTQQKSVDVTKEITGFKEVVDLDDLASKVTLEYPGKANIPSKVTELEKVQTSGFDAAKYEIMLEKIDKDNAKKLVKVTFKLVEKTTKKASASVTKEITGFREDVDLDAIAKTVRLLYPNKENIFVNNAVDTAISSSGYDATKYDVEIKKITPDVNTRVLLVTFSVKDKISKLSSGETTKHIFGFKEDKVVVEDIETIANNVKLDYPGKANILAKDAELVKVESSGFDDTKYEVKLESINIDSAKNLVDVTFKLVEKKTNKTSNFVKKQITGFKAETAVDLNELAKKVALEYPGKANILASEAVLKTVTSSGFEVSKYDITLEAIKPDNAKRLVEVTFKITNKMDKKSSMSVKKEITGFKAEVVINLDELAKKVNLEYPDKAKVLASEADLKKVTSSGFETAKYEVTLETIKPDNAKRLVEVTFKLTDKVTKKFSASVKKEITGFKTEVMVNLDELANKVTFEYTGKANVFAKDADLQKAVSSGFDATKYEVKIEKFDKDNAKKLVEVTFKLEDKMTKKLSVSVKKQITGFKEEVVSADLNELAKKVNFEYTGKANVFVKDANLQMVVSSGFEATKYEVKIEKFDKDNAKKLVIVTFKLEDKKTNKTSASVTKQITGFKEVVVINLDDLANKVTLEYPDKEKVLASEVDLKKVTSSGFEVDKYEVTLEWIEPDNSKKLAVVTFKLVEKMTKKTSASVTKEITGFKEETTEDLNNIAKKATIGYPDKEKIYAKDAVKGKVESTGLNESIHDLLIKSFTPDNSKGLVNVTYFVKNKKTKLMSAEVTKQITGFKVVKEDLDTIANKVVLEYPDKENVLPSDVDLKKVTSSGFEVDNYEVTLEIIEPDNSKKIAVVTFKLVDKMTKKTSASVTKEITGFKEETTEDLNNIAKKATIEYPDKEKIYAKDAEKGKVESTGLNESIHDLLIKNFVPDHSKGLVDVTYFVKNKKTKLMSDDITIQITGFKLEKSEWDILNDIAKKATINYPDKEKTYAKDAEQGRAEPTGFNESTHDLLIRSFIPDELTGWVKVTYFIKDKKTNSTSANYIRQIKGFKTILDYVASNVIIEYPKKSELYANGTNIELFEYSGFDAEKYEILKELITTHNGKGAVEITFKIRDKVSQKTSASLLKSVTGFKIAYVNWEELAKKVTLEYPKKSEVFAKDADLKTVISSGFDDKWYEVSIVSIKPDNFKGHVDVTFKIIQKPTKISGPSFTKKITGFKTEIPRSPLDSIAEAVTLNYPDKANVLAEDTMDSKIIVNNLDTEKYEVVWKSIQKDNKNKRMLLTFVIKEKTTEKISRIIGLVITGFKAPAVSATNSN